jgi:hypothetical protein
MLQNQFRLKTIEISKNFLDEHIGITQKQQFLGIILCLFKMAVAIGFLRENFFYLCPSSTVIDCGQANHSHNHAGYGNTGFGVFEGGIQN